MSGCQRQCDWDENDVCRTCGIDYSPPKPAAELSQQDAIMVVDGTTQSEESGSHESERTLRPFHLAFPVDDLPAARKFYTEVLGCTTGREKEESCVFNFYGHQIVAHRVPKMPDLSLNPVDGKKVPAITRSQFNSSRARLVCGTFTVRCPSKWCRDCLHARRK